MQLIVDQFQIQRLKFARNNIIHSSNTGCQIYITLSFDFFRNLHYIMHIISFVVLTLKATRFKQ